MLILHPNPKGATLKLVNFNEIMKCFQHGDPMPSVTSAVYWVGIHGDLSPPHDVFTDTKWCNDKVVKMKEKKSWDSLISRGQTILVTSIVWKLTFVILQPLSLCMLFVAVFYSSVYNKLFHFIPFYFPLVSPSCKLLPYTSNYKFTILSSL